jgi:LysR family transcriptional regulator, benzoate and cis,cis-muconate-responsive activator of ben and cat genes
MRHLVYFRTIAELGSIAKAAAALHMTQPTLSRQLAQLERGVGHQLLHRTARGTVLTPAGEGLRAHVERLLEQTERIPQILSAAAEAKALINLGVPPALPHQWFTDFRAQLRQSAPQVRLSLQEATSEQQRRWLQQGVIDVGLVHLEPPELKSRLVLTQQLGCVVRPHSEFQGISHLTWHDLHRRRVMAHSPHDNPGQHARLQAAADAAGADITWVLRSFSEHGSLIADSLDIDMVVISRSSATRHFPHWEWIPMCSGNRPTAVCTWAVWRDDHSPAIEGCLTAMARVPGIWLP